MSAAALLTVPRHVCEWTTMSEQALEDVGELRAGNLCHNEINKREKLKMGIKIEEQHSTN